MSNDTKFLSATEVALKLGIGVSTVWAMDKRGALPKPVRLGKRHTRWRLEDIEKLPYAQKSDVSCNLKDELNIRDQFAIAALTGLLVSGVGRSFSATSAYEIADAMLEERKEKK
jgi:predicted DNA-binding transcriptional regulator AlpA